jgi:hypothetical protein
MSVFYFDNIVSLGVIIELVNAEIFAVLLGLISISLFIKLRAVPT